MDDLDLSYYLSEFSSYNHAFQISDVLDRVESSGSEEILRHFFWNDPRFIRLGERDKGQEYFITDKALFLWLANLNIRIAETKPFIQHTKLTLTQLKPKLSSLLIRDGSLPIINQVIEYGSQYGLIKRSINPECVVFPIAHFLSLFSDKTRCRAARLMLALADKETRQKLLSRLLVDHMELAFSKLDARTVLIVKQREGIFNHPTRTLEEIGKDLSVTRERVRQIQAKFFKKMKHPTRRTPLLLQFECDLIQNRGTLLVDTNTVEGSLRRFVTKCLDVPHADFDEIGVSLLGAKWFDISNFKNSFWRIKPVEALGLFGELLEAKSGLSLADTDVQELFDRMNLRKVHELTRGQRVHLVLKQIGRPAHYSEVTEIHNKMFPDSATTQRNIHATLSYEQHGVVWIGMRGTFALEEWGYEKPAKGLYETVADIVNEIYMDTEKPVSFATIVAEMGKYRKLVNQSSLVFAAHFNPQVKRVAKDAFVPKGLEDDVVSDMSEDELDNLLREFEDKVA
ncbi:MAG: hypothetical protein FJ320_05890 [SAR202 cluster bacterium]|nr:hypothetical protein [SAR202 cluster bacterium]